MKKWLKVKTFYCKQMNSCFEQSHIYSVVGQTKVLFLKMVLRRLVCLLVLLSGFASGQSLQVNVFDEHELYLKYTRSYKVGWQLMQQAAKDNGIELVANEAIWIRSISFLKQQKGVTVVFGAMPSAERAGWTSFSAPLSVEHIAAYARLNSPYYEFEDLLKFKQHITLGVGRGTIHQDIAQRYEFKYIHTFTKRAKMFEMMEVGKVDAIIYTHAITSFYCGKYKNLSNNQCVKRLGNPIENSTLHFMYDKSDSSTVKIVEELHKSIDKMYRSGEVKKRFLTGEYNAADYTFWEEKYLNWLVANKQ